MRRMTTVVAMVARCRVDSVHVLTKDSAVTGAQLCITRSSSYTMPLLNRPAHSKATLGDRSFSFDSSSI